MREQGIAAGPGRLIAQECGGSLPGVLIAVAVGAILLGAFLSHVSTRMLSLSAVEVNLEEQYAADSAAEFATWTLLNDTAFQDNVDNAYPNPVAVPTSITINGLTPSLSAAAVYQRGWVSRAATPESINQGGDLTYGDGYIYALWWRGNTINIWRYHPSSNSWTTISTGPSGAKVGNGTTITYHDGKIYAILGNKGTEFWQFTIGGSWAKIDDLPDETGDGSDMVVVGNDIYVLQGKEGNCTGNNHSCDKFWSSPIPGNNWNESLDRTPGDVGPGGSLAYGGGNYIYAIAGDDQSDFWSYELSTGDWHTLTSLPNPDTVGDGGSIAYTGNGTLHVLLGGGSTGVRRYDINNPGWTTVEPALNGIGRAGSVAWDYDKYIYVLRGGNNTDFWRYFSAPPEYDLSASAGSTTLLSRIQLIKPQAHILWWDWQ